MVMGIGFGDLNRGHEKINNVNLGVATQYLTSTYSPSANKSKKGKKHVFGFGRA